MYSRTSSFSWLRVHKPRLKSVDYTQTLAALLATVGSVGDHTTTRLLSISDDRSLAARPAHAHDLILDALRMALRRRDRGRLLQPRAAPLPARLTFNRAVRTRPIRRTPSDLRSAHGRTRRTTRLHETSESRRAESGSAAKSRRRSKMQR